MPTYSTGCTISSAGPGLDAFFAGIADDPPLAEGLAVARTLADGHEVVYLTGRPERYRRATQDWRAATAAPVDS